MRKAVLVVAALLCAFTLAAQMGADKSKRPSPPGQAQVTFADGKSITIDYSRPYAKGRKIFGGLVPYGKEWRTGANEATTFVTTADLMVAGKHVPAGKYTLYTIPNENEWTLIINKQTGQWGTVYKEDQDLVRVPMKVGKTSGPVEQFTILLEKTGAKAATLKLQWENTQASVEVTEH
ncbi:MAG TPA: DUF2911 domain-containing protein [Terriglobales bacterium]|jgi:hypothetical protein|nr:DUF2911 domain-containing protein [Terriglobales bacterium]